MLKTDSVYPFLDDREKYDYQNPKGVSSYTSVKKYTKNMKFMSSWLGFPAYDRGQPDATFPRCPRLGLCNDVQRLNYPICQDV